jgi:hypothetical protein
MRVLIAAAAVLAGASPAWAQNCPKPQDWTKPERHLAARVPEMKFALKPGGTVQIGLLPQEQVRFAAGKPSRKGYAGLAAIDVPRAGILQVAVDNKTYVDVVRAGKPLALVGEPKTKGCTGVQKILEFKVAPGRYLVQLSGSPDKTVRIVTSLR